MKNKFSDNTLNTDSVPEHDQEPTETGKIKLLDVVALTQDVPEHDLKRGEVGTVVEILANGEAFEVEFSDDNGQMYKSLSFTASQLKVLHQELVSESKQKRQPATRKMPPHNASSKRWRNHHISPMKTLRHYVSQSKKGKYP